MFANHIRAFTLKLMHSDVLFLLERSHGNQKLPHEISQSRLELSSFHTAGPDGVSDNSSVTTKIVI